MFAVFKVAQRFAQRYLFLLDDDALTKKDPMIAKSGFIRSA
jgi:hypothetical protein